MKQFDHEKLNVYQSSVAFVAWTTDLLESIPKNGAAHNQLDRASTSIPPEYRRGQGVACRNCLNACRVNQGELG